MEKKMHPRNVHNEDYDFRALVEKHAALSSYVKKNKFDALGVDFSNADAVMNLNQALLIHHYKVENWSILKGHLCPAVPGRVDYIHYIADLLSKDTQSKIPVGTKVKGLDIGTGAGCIYPILGNSIYGWKFVGTDIDNDSLNHAKSILRSNPTLKKNIKIRYQQQPSQIFKNIIKTDEKFDFTMCNPPFYSSLEEASSASDRKVKNLNSNREKKGSSPINKNKASNFGGVKSELWCDGGELGFIERMIKESVEFKEQCRWFTTLVSNKSHLEKLQLLLDEAGARVVTSTQMNQGQKKSSLLAWYF